jgi:hypothetical protein
LDTGNYIAIGGMIIALAGARIALLGTRLTYKAAMRSLENQRLLADREAAGKVLDARSVELAEIDDKLEGLADCLADSSETSILRARRDHIPLLRDAGKKMEREHERLRIRFRSNVSESFGSAPASIMQFLGGESVKALVKVKIRDGIALESAESAEARRASFQKFLNE